MDNHEWGIRSGEGKYENAKFSKYSQVYGKSEIRDSLIYGNSVVNSSTIINSSLDGGALCSHCVLSNSYVGSSAKVFGGSVQSSVISGSAVIAGGIIDGCHIGDFASISGKPLIANCDIFDSAQIEGECYVEGVTLENFDYIHEGRWVGRKPLSFPLSSGFIVSQCVVGRTVISCMCRPTEWWFKNGRKFGRRMGLTSLQIDEMELSVLYLERIRGKNE